MGEKNRSYPNEAINNKELPDSIWDINQTDPSLCDDEYSLQLQLLYAHRVHVRYSLAIKWEDKLTALSPVQAIRQKTN